jgi:HD-GYP domain-containing protein (c-di-GMP phosphodiesterase class II)
MPGAAGRPFRGGGAPRSRLTPRVIAVIVILLVIFLGWTFFWLLYAEQQALMDARRYTLAENVGLALSLCQELHDRAESGELAHPVARAEAARLLGYLRYGPQKAGYFYIIDGSGVMVMHPLRPSLAGSDIRQLTDADDNCFLARIIEQSRHYPTGFSSYRYNWHGDQTQATPLTAYSASFSPWNWIVVSELGTADIQAMVMGELLQQALLLALLTVVLASVLSITLKRLVLQGVDRLIEVAGQLRGGDLSARAEILPADEMGPLAQAINQMAEGIQQRDAQIRQTQRAAVFALANLAEARDNETGGHLLRVREYVAALAALLRSRNGWAGVIDDDFIADLYDASMLHDIGKVAIPDNILRKPDVLDEGEKAIMMSHTLVGANTIRAARKRMRVRSSFLTMAEQIARSHHERWDGNGYVEGLAGESIPLAARIFALADVYDALTTARPYKPAYSHEQALETMREERGKIFDPQLFDAFVEHNAAFDRIRREFGEESAA